MSTTNPPLPEFEIDPRALRHLADAQVNVELDTGDMILNLGPAAPGDPRHAAPRRAPRRRARRRRPTRSSATCTAATRSSPSSARTRRSPR